MEQDKYFDKDQEYDPQEPKDPIGLIVAIILMLIIAVSGWGIVIFCKCCCW